MDIVNSSEKKIESYNVRNAVQSFTQWKELGAAIDAQDSERVNELVDELVNLIELEQITYVKRTFEIQEDLLDRLKIFCVRNHWKQKTVINIAIETLLNAADAKG